MHTNQFIQPEKPTNNWNEHTFLCAPMQSNCLTNENNSKLCCNNRIWFTYFQIESNQKQQTRRHNDEGTEIAFALPFCCICIPSRLWIKREFSVRSTNERIDGWKVHIDSAFSCSRLHFAISTSPSGWWGCWALLVCMHSCTSQKQICFDQKSLRWDNKVRICMRILCVVRISQYTISSRVVAVLHTKMIWIHSTMHAAYAIRLFFASCLHLW